MEWKKEKITASELERRQKEYMNAALSMMKRSHTSVSVTVAPGTVTHVPVSSTPSDVGSDTPAKEAETSDTTVFTPAFDDSEDAAEKPEDKAEKPEDEAEKPEDKAEKPEYAAEKPEDAEDTASENEEKQEQPGEDAESTKYGVYTADELLSGEYNDDGLKKAAEILEEMTRSTAYMKKLADGGDDDDDPDITDFPDFSCPEESCGDDSSFRREEDERCPEPEAAENE